MVKKPLLCNKCQEMFEPKFITFNLNKVKCLSIYEYDENIKSLLYQLKGCFDIELAPLFLYRYVSELRLLFSGFILVPAPSSKIDDEKREFNHVIEIFSPLKLQILKSIEKADQYKQSDQNKDNRANIKKHLKMSLSEKMQNKKILIVDDVFTTGCTIKAMIELIRSAKPKEIRVLTIAKVKNY